MLMANRVKDFTQAWWNAKVYRPDGIIAGTDTWDKLVEKRQVKSIPYPWEGLNHLTRGHRPYELVTITSGSGMGKSQFIREIEYDLLQRCEGNIGVLALEEDVARTSLGIMSVAANRPSTLGRGHACGRASALLGSHTGNRTLLPIRPLGVYFSR